MFFSYYHAEKSRVFKNNANNLEVDELYTGNTCITYRDYMNSNLEHKLLIYQQIKKYHIGSFYMSLSRKIVATGVCVFLLSACGSQTSNTSSGRNSREILQVPIKVIQNIILITRQAQMLQIKVQQWQH